MKYPVLLLIVFSCVMVGCGKKKKPSVRQSPAPVVTNPQVNSTGSSLSAQEAKTALSLHNRIRADVGVSPLTWSNTAASYVQNWLNHLAANNCNLEHRPNNQYGENLFIGTAGFYGVDSAVKSWEQEKHDYHGEPINNHNFSVVGHYTQMVWRNTTQVGCGKAICQNQVIVGCNYAPAGNYIGQKPF